MTIVTLNPIICSKEKDPITSKELNKEIKSNKSKKYLKCLETNHFLRQNIYIFFIYFN